MHWHFRKPTYDFLIPKLDKSISKLNEQEAADYFAWFMDQVPNRVAYVSHVCAKELHIPAERMDCSPESLLLLWKWFRRRARTEKYIPSADEQKYRDQFGDQAWLPKRQLTLETEYIIRDVGIYLGETLRKNCENIHWTYYTKPRRDFFVNHPLLQGFIDRSTGKPFEASFEPIHFTHVQAAKLLDNSSSNTDLLNIYTIWSKKK